MGAYWAYNGRSSGADQLIGREDRTATIISPAPIKAPCVPVVYFALAVGGNLVKIGTVVGAERVEKRMALLQPGCPYDLKVLLVLPEFGRREEVRLHRLYAAYCHRGEWFRCEGDLKAMLQTAHVDGVEAAISHLRSK
ncbi:MAG: GIY-YIG nuclease family protein, partial [Tabrizicola sp.]|nr:GIY-YIG nuclease family protein [Tabrizicola sp.]